MPYWTQSLQQEFTLERTCLAVPCVQNRLLSQNTCGDTKVFTLERNRLAVPCVQNRFPSHQTCRDIKEFTLERNRLAVPSVQNRLPGQETCGYIKEFTLERNRLAVPCVRNRSPSQETCGYIKEFTLLKNSKIGLSAQSCLPFLADLKKCNVIYCYENPYWCSARGCFPQRCPAVTFLMTAFSLLISWTRFMQLVFFYFL